MTVSDAARQSRRGGPGSVRLDACCNVLPGTATAHLSQKVGDTVDGIPATAPGYRNYASFKQWQGRLFEIVGADYFEAELRGFLSAGARVVEVGFGAGHCLAWLVSKGAHATGLEIQESLVLVGRQRGFDTHHAHAFDWQALQGQVDLILGFDVLEHLTDGELVALLRAGAAALRPGGAMLFRFPNMASPFGLHYQAADPTHVTPVSGPRIVSLLAEHGITGLTLETWRDAALPHVRGMKAGMRRMAGSALRHLTRLVLHNGYLRGEPIPLAMNAVAVLRKQA